MRLSPTLLFPIRLYFDPDIVHLDMAIITISGRAEAATQVLLTALKPYLLNLLEYICFSSLTQFWWNDPVYSFSKLWERCNSSGSFWQRQAGWCQQVQPTLKMYNSGHGDYVQHDTEEHSRAWEQQR